MSPILAGGIGGLAATLGAQLVTALADETLRSEAWLKGPHGPPFFNVALFMGLLYGGLAFALSRRRGPTALGILGPFLGIAVPMLVMTRLFAWTGTELAPDERWVRAVTIVYVLAVWGTVAALGWALAGGWRGALLAVAASFASFLCVGLIQWAAPGLLFVSNLTKALPQPAALVDGALTGALLGGAVLISRRLHEKRSPA